MSNEATKGSSRSSERGDRHVVFSVAARALSLPVDAVREVVDLRGLLRVPAAPASVLGIMSLRGTILSVLDGAHVLTGERSAAAPSKVLVIVRDDEVLCGLAVDKVAAITALPTADPLRDRSTAPDPLVSGHYDLGGGELVAAVDPARLYRHIDGQRLSTAAHPAPFSAQELGR